METKSFSPMRRNFLFAVGAAPAIGIAVLAGSKPEQSPPAVSGQQVREPEASSYHVTEHIRKYYYAAGYF
jgi:hypothetical protein